MWDLTKRTIYFPQHSCHLYISEEEKTNAYFLNISDKLAFSGPVPDSIPSFCQAGCLINFTLNLNHWFRWWRRRWLYKHSSKFSQTTAADTAVNSGGRVHITYTSRVKCRPSTSLIQSDSHVKEPALFRFQNLKLDVKEKVLLFGLEKIIHDIGILHRGQLRGQQW